MDRIEVVGRLLDGIRVVQSRLLGLQIFIQFFLWMGNRRVNFAVRPHDHIISRYNHVCAQLAIFRLADVQCCVLVNILIIAFIPKAE